MILKLISFLLVFLSIGSISFAAVKEYDLVINYQQVNITGHEVKAMTINGSIPGPTLRFNVGDTAMIHVKNKMDEETSIHWHGILLPNLQDGVPYVTTPPIEPAATFTYEFPIKHSGTYWYHSHTGLQEQRGVFGSIVIEPEVQRIKADREYVLMLSDWTDENPDEVLRTLKSGNSYYSLKKGSMQSVLGAIRAHAVPDVLKRSWMRMPPVDVSDIGYDSFLINGRAESSVDADAGTTLRLRIINGSASTYFYLQFAGGDMMIISADGPDVQPVHLDRFLIAVAETYDVIITVPDGGSYELRATAQDGSGHVSLFIGKGEKILASDIPKPNLYKMHSSNHQKPAVGMKPMKGMRGHDTGMDMTMTERPMPPYEELRSLEPTGLSADHPVREVRLELTGDMERYVWSMNGRVLREADLIEIKKGENVRFILVNKTMMHHPMHLHGHFFRVVNKHGDYSPLKHTVDVPPLGTTVIEFYANEVKDWFFHCHVLYHLKTGMARIVRYQGSEMAPVIAGIRKNLFRDHWYLWAKASVLTQMTEGRIVAADTRNNFIAEWEAGWGEDYEGILTYERYFNRFISAFAGGVLTDSEQKDRWIGGIRYLLPFLVESRLWIDSEGDFRITLDKNIRLTSRLFIFGEYQHDSDTREEWRAGAGWTISKHISAVFQYHSEYNGGAGILMRF